MPRLIVLLGLLGLLLSASPAGAVSPTTINAAQLAAAVAQAAPGDTIVVSGGTYHGNLVLDKPLTLLGQDWPVIDGDGQGTVVQITRPGTTLRGFVIRGSGHSLDQENSGIAVEAENSLIENNRFEETLFGIYLRQAHNSTLRGNIIHSLDLPVPRRGDPIRVWYSNDVLVENNTAFRGRDVVLWYSQRLTVRGNDVQSGRYGLHFMYCDDAHIENNRLLNNSVGAFLMYSRRMVLQHNTIAGNRGPSGYGIGLKDMDDAIVKENRFLDNRVGAYLDGSPREVDSIGQFEGNIFAYNDIGVELLPAVRHNQFFANSFIDNGEQVAIAGGGRPGENAWTVDGQGNYWSDYAGYDANGDARGDMAYRSERLFESLTAQSPNLRLFLYSPAVNAIEFAATAFPLVRPQPKLVDEQPLMQPVIPAQTPALPQAAATGWFVLSAVLLALALTITGLPRLGQARYRFAANLTSPPSEP